MTACTLDFVAGRPSEGKKRTIVLDDEDHALVCDVVPGGGFTAGFVAMIDLIREARGLPKKDRRPRVRKPAEPAPRSRKRGKR